MIDLNGACGTDTPFGFAQGRLYPTPLTLILILILRLCFWF
jgi:hypothetical protein